MRGVASGWGAHYHNYLPQTKLNIKDGIPDDDEDDDDGGDYGDDDDKNSQRQCESQCALGRSPSQVSPAHT